ncbi:NAD(P)/FAD-dependent oxidoreductase [Chondrinema litorale]|uniref:NAD(P)/FAD-dependent oxidoreductase n=1 Tax=Chondrinema litorale TaxID=2994555 RepID=UPI0025430F68|nr:FAD-dependent oxidoreductase [Chondrinema litorale]UZR96069.1 FAD-dependent oxidoreductase [Chondrinema litorale]
MISFWEKQTFVHSHFLIIGSGITGLSTALSLREKYPTKNILVLERGIFPSGASTKNAGFACFGSLTELISDYKTLGELDMLALIEKRRRGLETLRSRLGDEEIDYQQHGGYELITENEIGALEHIKSMNTRLMPLFGEPVFSMKNEDIRKFGFDENTVKALVYNPFEGQIHTGKMMRALLKLAAKKNIQVYTGTEVESIEDINNRVYVKIKDKIHSELTLRSKKLIVCTNAFSKKLIPNLELNPGRGQVLVTEPIDDLKIKGTFHFEEGYYYFRNIGDRVIFGGGRNIDLEGETTTEMNTTDRIINNLKEKLEKVIMPNQPFKVEQTWAGIMAFGKNKTPIIERVSPNVTVAARLGGMGVAIGTAVGEQAASLVYQE